VRHPCPPPQVALEYVVIVGSPDVRGMDGPLIFGDKHSLTNRVDLQNCRFLLISKGMILTVARRHYKNAPITEAVIDVQIDNVAGKTIEDVTRLADSLRSEFPVRMPVFQLQMGFQTDISGTAGPQFHNDQQNLGWRLNSKTQTRVLQIRTNGFTYSHLPPYSNWETFSAEAQGLWSQYVDEIAPQSAKRIAVRVINKLPVSARDGDFNTVLNLYPWLPDGLPQNVRGLSLQVQLPMEHIDENALLNLALFTGVVFPGDAGLILDIDLFIEKSVPVGSQIFEFINKLGLAKDDVFEACITDKIRERIQ
jgi:uncharacterized protein (TIGR04255 family)